MAGVYFEGSLENAYRVCLWSRIANRVLLVLSSFTVTSQEDLYAGIYKVNWFDHMKPDDSFAVSFNAKASKVINNTQVILDWQYVTIGKLGRHFLGSLQNIHRP
jgi:23S rRNA (guanine2445-N2)-methyltransferase / 23S rRNA (guanine2069-N7)-methyltransferase